MEWNGFCLFDPKIEQTQTPCNFLENLIEATVFFLFIRPIISWYHHLLTMQYSPVYVHKIHFWKQKLFKSFCSLLQLTKSSLQIHWSVYGNTDDAFLLLLYSFEVKTAHNRMQTPNDLHKNTTYKSYISLPQASCGYTVYLHQSVKVNE